MKMTTATLESHIGPIRDASRRLVRELGFMRATLAGTNLPPSAVHAHTYAWRDDEGMT